MQACHKHGDETKAVMERQYLLQNCTFLCYWNQDLKCSHYFTEVLPYIANFLCSFQIKFCPIYTLTAHPHFELQIFSTVRFSMLRHHFGLPVYHDSFLRLHCSHCQTRMDHLGDPSSIRKSVLGVVHQYSKFWNVFAREVFRSAGLSVQRCSFRAPLAIRLYTGSAACPAIWSHPRQTLRYLDLYCLVQ